MSPSMRPTSIPGPEIGSCPVSKWTGMIGHKTSFNLIFKKINATVNEVVANFLVLFSFISCTYK